MSKSVGWLHEVKRAEPEETNMKTMLSLGFHLSEHMEEMANYREMWILEMFYFTCLVKKMASLWFILLSCLLYISVGDDMSIWSGYSVLSHKSYKEH